MWTLYQTLMGKRELILMAKPSIYRSIHDPTLTYGREPWVVIQTMRTLIQTAKNEFPSQSVWARPHGQDEELRHAEGVQ